MDGTYETILRALESDPHIRGLFSVNLRCTLMLAEAVRTLGLQRRVFAVGSDLCDESAQALRQGELFCLISKNPGRAGTSGCQTADRLSSSRSQAGIRNGIPSVGADFQSNLEQFL